jgi:hypothetical protein
MVLVGLRFRRVATIVHAFPRGWVSPVFPLASVVYNAALGIYIMANSNSTGGDAVAHNPSYLGILIALIALHPWGPWRQVHEETAWTPAGDPKARAGGGHRLLPNG